MSDAKKAIHSIRNDLTSLLFFVEAVREGTVREQQFALRELVRKSKSIESGLDILSSIVRLEL